MNTRDALVACLPPQAYDRHVPGVQAEAASAAKVLDGALDSADVVLLEHQPEQASDALLDWERNYHLPDDCVGGLGATLDERRKSLLGRIYGRGDLSRGFMVDQAAALGYPGCTVTEFGPLTCADPCDSTVNGSEFIGVWRLNVPVSTAIATATCADPCDSPLRRWGNTQLECVINRRKPAHTLAIFGYAP